MDSKNNKVLNEKNSRELSQPIKNAKNIKSKQ